MKLRNVSYHARQALTSMRRNIWLTLAAILAVSISLFVLGSFVLIALNTGYIADSLESSLEAAIYINQESSSEVVEQVGEDLKAYPEVADVKLVTKEEGLKQLAEDLGQGESLLETLGGTNPLPDYYRVRVTDPRVWPVLSKKIKQIPGVEEVDYGQGLVERLVSATNWIRWAGMAGTVILALAAIVLIIITIRLAVFSRRHEVAIMKYVGATNWFIRWPFVLEGALMGLIGSVFSGVVLFFGYSLVLNYIADGLAFITLVDDPESLRILMGSLIAGGLVLGALGSVLSISRFLRT